MGAKREIHAVEFLGDGQQAVVEGIHPKTMEPYRWRDGISPADVGAANLTEITLAQIDAYFAECRTIILEEGGEIITTATARAAAHGGHVPDVNLVAPSLAAIEAALAAIPNEVDYDTWLKVMVACKAAWGEEAYELIEAWSLQWPENSPELVRDKWESFGPPYQVGWSWLSRFAQDKGGFSPAKHEFELELGGGDDDDDDDDDDRAKARAAGGMFGRCVWVERQELVFDTVTLKTYNRQQLNLAWYRVGNPADAKGCAWAVFSAEGALRRSVDNITYRPGGKLFLREELTGECVNTWRPPLELPPPPGSVTEAECAPFFKVFDFVMGDVREHVLDLWAAKLQFPGRKVNYGLMVGSKHQGIGKSMLLKPLRFGLGGHNVRDIGAEEMHSNFNGWMLGAAVVVIEEMHSHGKATIGNKMKPLFAAPPPYLPVNPKYGKATDVPNIVLAIVFTNHEDALALERSDRRVLVVWNDKPPLPARDYIDLDRFFTQGGDAKVVRLLLDRDLSHFNFEGRAPMTEAKEAMRVASLHPSIEWLEEVIADRAYPFHRELVTVDEILAATPRHIAQRYGLLSGHKVGVLLAEHGFTKLGRPTVNGVRVSAWAVKNAHHYDKLSMEMLAARIVKQRSDFPVDNGDKANG